MNKITLIIAVAGLSLASCKKDRTCTCTITNTSFTANGVTQTTSAPTTSTTKLTKVSKGSANCNSGETTTNYSFGGTNFVDVNKNDCKLS